MSALGYKREIDGLRAVAVLAVVLYHAEPSWLPGGFQGVDVFFVISGYLITSLLLLERRQTGTLDLVAFYARRMRRLLPALCAVVLVSVPLAAWLIPDGHRALLRSAAASLLFVGNVYFQQTTGNYFDTPTDQVPLLHLWSLGVEEQFYFVLPPLLLLAMRWRGTRGLVTALVAASIVSLLLAEHWIQLRPSIAFYQMPARFWELAAGGLVAMAPRDRLGWRAATAFAWLGLCTILAAMALGSTMHFPGVGALATVLGTAGLLWSVHDGARIVGVDALLRARPMVFFGLISYSLYLWHWPLLAILRGVIWQPSLAARFGVCAVAVMLAYLSYRHVERPFRRATHDPAIPRRTVLAGVGVSAVLATALVALGQYAPPPAQDEQSPLALRGEPERLRACHFGLAHEVERLQATECNSDPSTPPTQVLWGDSHALAWRPFAWSVAQASSTSVASFTLDSCPPIANFDTYRADFPRHLENCRRFNGLAMEYIRRNTPDEVILAGRWLLYFQPRSKDGQRIQSPESFEAGIVQMIDEIAPNTPRIVLMGPLPALQVAAPRCLATPGDERCTMPREEYERLAGRVWTTFRRIASRHPNVELVDPAEFFCGPRNCPAVRDGYALFWDSNHVSATAARRFAQVYLDDPGRWLLRPVAGR